MAVRKEIGTVDPHVEPKKRIEKKPTAAQMRRKEAAIQGDLAKYENMSEEELLGLMTQIAQEDRTSMNQTLTNRVKETSENK